VVFKGRGRGGAETGKGERKQVGVRSLHSKVNGRANGRPSKALGKAGKICLNYTLFKKNRPSSLTWLVTKDEESGCGGLEALLKGYGHANSKGERSLEDRGTKRNPRTGSKSRRPDQIKALRLIKVLGTQQTPFRFMTKLKGKRMRSTKDGTEDLPKKKPGGLHGIMKKGIGSVASPMNDKKLLRRKAMHSYQTRIRPSSHART